MENRETKGVGRENRILFMLKWFFLLSEKFNFIYFFYIKRFADC